MFPTSETWAKKRRPEHGSAGRVKYGTLLSFADLASIVWTSLSNTSKLKVLLYSSQAIVSSGIPRQKLQYLNGCTEYRVTGLLFIDPDLLSHFEWCHAEHISCNVITISGNDLIYGHSCMVVQSISGMLISSSHLICGADVDANCCSRSQIGNTMPHRRDVGPKILSTEHCIPRDDAYCLTGNQRELHASSSCFDPVDSLNDSDGQQMPLLKHKSHE